MLYDPKWEMPVVTKPAMPEWKAKWVAALRSGLYKKCIGSLCAGPYRHCALGVLFQEVGVERFSNVYAYDMAVHITHMNDTLGWSFSKIADWIENNERSNLCPSAIS